MHKCVIPAEGLAPSHQCLWVSQCYTTHSVTLLCLWGLMEFWVPGGMRLLQLLRRSSDTGKQSGEKLNPAASCIQWVKWWSIHSGQDAGAPQFNPCSRAIRTTAIPQWSLLLAGCSWWCCSLGNDYLAIKANVCFISAFFKQKFWEDIMLQLGTPFALWVLNLNRHQWIKVDVYHFILLLRSLCLRDTTGFYFILFLCGNQIWAFFFTLFLFI